MPTGGSPYRLWQAGRLLGATGHLPRGPKHAERTATPRREKIKNQQHGRTEAWTIQALAVALPMATVHAMCARGARRGGATATFVQRGDQSARVLVWSAPDARGGARPLGAFSVSYAVPGADEATLREVSWPPDAPPTDLWSAIEELAGRPIPH